MKSAILAAALGFAAAQQVDLDYFNDDFSVFQEAFAPGGQPFPGPLDIAGFDFMGNAVISTETIDGSAFDRTMTLSIPATSNVASGTLTQVGSGFWTLAVGIFANGPSSSVLEYTFSEALDLTGFNALKMLLLKADAGYELSLEMCSAGNMCSSFLINGMEGGGGIALFHAEDFVGTAEVSAIEKITAVITALPLGDIQVGTLTTLYFGCSEADLNNAIGNLQVVEEGCFFGMGEIQNAYEMCEVCCTNSEICVNYTCTEPEEGVVGEWVGDQMCPSIMEGDPHLTGFNGEKMDIAHDASFKSGQLLNLFCADETSIFAELASTETADVYITSVFGKYDGLAFSMNIFNEVRVSTDATYTDDAARKHFISGNSQVTVSADGSSLSSDDGKVKINVAAHTQNGVDYLDVQLSSLAGRYPAGGMLGRTLNTKVTDAEFSEYSSFVVAVDELSTFTCEF